MHKQRDPSALNDRISIAESVLGYLASKLSDASISRVKVRPQVDLQKVDYIIPFLGFEDPVALELGFVYT
jgi:hypothetical protein